MTFRNLVAALLCAGLLATPALGETLKLRATLEGVSEVPPNASKATGAGDFTVDTVTRQLTFRVVYDGLSGPATAGHIHGPAAPGANAPPVVPFQIPASPIMGTATLDESQVRELLGGLMYVNIHSASFPGGELRGQIVSVK